MGATKPSTARSNPNGPMNFKSEKKNINKKSEKLIQNGNVQTKCSTKDLQSLPEKMAISPPNGEEVVINSGGLLNNTINGFDQDIMEVGNPMSNGEVLNSGKILKPCLNNYSSRDM